MAKHLSDVLAGGLCSGCGGCAALAPDAVRMGISPDGFLRPVISAPLGDFIQKKIEAICPSIGQTLRRNRRKSDPVWGPSVRFEQGFATDAHIRHEAASGGALSGLLVHLLASERVDGVVHIGADPEHPMRNVTRVSRSRADILAGAGSRYAPSSPLEAVADLLGCGEVYAFVGKPCDVSAVAALREHDARVAQAFPVLISFLCAGVPSLHGAAQVAQQMGADTENLTSFAYRAAGWPGAARAVSPHGETFEMSYAQSWGDILSKHVQHRCKLCVDGAGVFADVAFGDAWEADTNGYPSFEDRAGQSAILIRTNLGAELIDAARAACVLETSPLELATFTKMQPGQVRRRKAVLARLFGLWVTGRAVPKFRGFGLVRMAVRAHPIPLLRNCLGMMRRALAIPRKGTRI